MLPVYVPGCSSTHILRENLTDNTYIRELSSTRGSSTERLPRFLYNFVLCCILLVLIVYAAVLFGGPGVVGVIVLVLLFFDFMKYLKRGDEHMRLDRTK